MAECHRGGRPAPRRAPAADPRSRSRWWPRAREGAEQRDTAGAHRVQQRLGAVGVGGGRRDPAGHLALAQAGGDGALRDRGVGQLGPGSGPDPCGGGPVVLLVQHLHDPPGRAQRDRVGPRVDRHRRVDHGQRLVAGAQTPGPHSIAARGPRVPARSARAAATPTRRERARHPPHPPGRSPTTSAAMTPVPAQTSDNRSRTQRRHQVTDAERVELPPRRRHAGHDAGRGARAAGRAAARGCRGR